MAARCERCGKCGWLRGLAAIPAPTAATVAAFKKAWHDADAKGMTGARVEAGLIAALQELLGD